MEMPLPLTHVPLPGVISSTGMSFFSSLGVDAVLEVFRQLSNKPRNKDWLNYIPEDVLVLIIDDCGPFARSLSNQLKSLSIGPCGSQFLRVLAKPAILSKVLRSLGARLNEIVLTDISYSDEFLSFFSAALIEHTAELKLISAVTSMNWKDVAAKHATSLQELEIRASYPPKCISYPGTSLLELKKLYLLLDGESCFAQNLSELASFLASSGGKLEDVTIELSGESVTEWTLVIDSLRTHCRRVENIILDRELYRSCISQEVKNLLISYSSQLRRADLVYFATTVLEEILPQCPNVLCKWDECYHGFPDGFPLDKFILLAPRIEELRFDEDLHRWLYSSTQREKFVASLSSLTKLKSYKSLRDDFFRDNPKNSILLAKSFFANRKSLLQNLTLRLQFLDRDLIFAITLSSLHLQCLSLFVDEANSDELLCLFHACPNLKTVSFSIVKFTVENALDFVKKIVQVAWTKLHLTELTFWFGAWGMTRWDDDQNRKFIKEMAIVVQKYRLRRCMVRFKRTNFFK